MSKKSKELLMFKKLLPILFLFTGFQANAVLIGNLTYDGTYISGDGRTYVGLDTIASWDYARTLAATQVNGVYEGFRIANTADADYFIGSLFGASADNCSTVDGTANYFEDCGNLNGWAGGVFGNNADEGADVFWFIADEGQRADVGYIQIYEYEGVFIRKAFTSFAESDKYAANGDRSGSAISWLLVKDTVAAPEPSIMALMGLGIFGIGFARRRRQS
jgi:hypothetical protein